MCPPSAALLINNDQSHRGARLLTSRSSIHAGATPTSRSEWKVLYPYTADLLALEFCRNTAQHISPQLRSVRSPLSPMAWAAALSGHPDRALAGFLLRGLSEGFRIGFFRSAPLRGATRNMLSALQHPEVVESYLEKECSLQRMLGPFPPETLPRLHINRFGVIPKGHNTGWLPTCPTRPGPV